ncbi:Oligoendopeptidase F [Agrilactobacillus composti DSM 18527 = JCM 14202]|uniref:Oligopeptidase F n=1 Tax=Agrilactobacillus composti DSM 18527 = JCM 14202 TaxID=1423734 RepID=X0PDP6_9LACO|nr:oligoendopeptidase F [Agrilactobacillus composti]KRM33652.1 Oligoendopeptidase F [Agrilactobacillus composti DSM 18527 = JCM 14202]GAF39178.1 oligoendopeptidase F [Agrilactobacillus composti DSM 18527 = JCM 14202]
MATQKQLPPRNQVPEALTWDLSALYPDTDAFLAAQQKADKAVTKFARNFAPEKLTSLDALKAALITYNQLAQQLDNIANYAELQQSEDLTDPNRAALANKANANLARWQSLLSAFDSHLTGLDDETLAELKAALPQFQGFLRTVKNQQKIRLDPKVEAALASLQPVFSGPSNIYSQARSADMAFPDFTVNGKTYPLSFTLYEDYYAYHPDTAVRRGAFAAFSKTLSQYQNTLAQTYLTQVTKEKQMATLRGFDSVVDYLLYDQEVDRSLFDRQIDLIMTKFGPVIQRYLKTLQKVRGLDELTFADRLIDLDPDFEPDVTIDASKTYVKDALSLLGPDYTNMILKAYPQRWVDYAQNIGKETGGFCAQPYGKQPYILLSWHDKLSDLYTLIHEMGHAGQGLLAQDNNAYLEFEPSTYIIEAPSTFNELLLTNALTKSAQAKGDLRLQRFALTKMLANTYFHNFVTHLLEAAYQREVYARIDAGESFSAQDLNAITRQVLQRFFGDALTLNPGAELTWMRQIHYYMGLYSYTYSASLTVSTQAFLRIQKEGQPAVDDWLTFLKLGNTKNPIDSAKVAGVDITTDQPLTHTIQFLSAAVDQIGQLTAQLDG